MNPVTLFCARGLAGIVLLIGMALLDDTDAAQDVADDALTAQQTAQCRAVRGPDAEVFTVVIDGAQHTVCRAAGPVAGVQP